MQKRWSAMLQQNPENNLILQPTVMTSKSVRTVHMEIVFKSSDTRPRKAMNQKSLQAGSKRSCTEKFGVVKISRVTCIGGFC